MNAATTRAGRAALEQVEVAAAALHTSLMQSLQEATASASPRFGRGCLRSTICASKAAARILSRLWQQEPQIWVCSTPLRNNTLGLLCMALFKTLSMNIVVAREKDGGLDKVVTVSVKH